MDEVVAMTAMEYLSPSTLSDAVALWSVRGDDAQLLAGGTDLVVRMNRTGIRPNCLISLKKLSELKRLECGDGGLALGSLVTMSALEKSPVVQARYSALAQACALVGPAQNRNRATLGGNLCNASPAADTAPALIALDAQLRIVGPRGERMAPVEDFFVGPGKTILGRGEILAGIHIPDPPPRSGSAYLRCSPRKAMDISVVGVAARVVLCDDGRTFSDARLALASVAPKPLRAHRAEGVLRRKVLSEAMLRETAEVACAEASPIDDVRGSSAHRADMIRVFVRRALQSAVDAAAGRS
ncbi:MAG: xanthine dehydrogenase family protein subunit M [Planctomycetes bacterium]|nr:xanthine dehydrogenase family protein subunit M [Planctomycetota bacterium]